MSQRHFCIRTHHRRFLAFLVFIPFLLFIIPDSAYAQDTLIVKFQWTTRTPVPGIEYYGKTPNFPKPIISFIKVEDELGLHVPGLASINEWLKPDDIAEIELSPPALERLGEIEIPVQVMIGELDLAEKVALADRLVRDIPKSSKVVIPDVAHMLNMENPEVFNRSVLEFLSKI